MNRYERMLVWLLRLTAAGTMLAVAPMVMPHAWWDWAHRWMGQGAFPDAPAVDYLTRSVCAFYAMFGGLLWVVSADVRRHERVIRYVAWVGAVFSVFITVVDALLALPWYWTWTEGPLTLVVCAVILILQARTPEGETA